VYEPKWVFPETIDEAVRALADESGRARAIAGATDLAVRIRAAHDGPATLVDLTRIREMSFVHADGDTLTIGATASHAAVAGHPVVRERATALALACGTVGSPQIRARGTIGGNLVNASPAADSAVALAALNAVAHVRSSRGAREIPVTGLFAGPGETFLAEDELLTQVKLTLPSAGAASTYRKLGQRRALAIAIASVAATFDPEAGAVRIALGSVAPTVVRATGAEELFEGGWGSVEEQTGLIEAVAAEAVSASCPIDDVRASARYRAILVGELTLEALEELCLAEPRVSA
jgi:CO/xanthine dehydrogenase FAD-binding subunit